MADGNDNAVSDATKKIDETIAQLKAWLEDIVEMKVECAKLEFDMLGLYKTICPEILDGVRDDLQNANNNTEDLSNLDNNK